MAIDHKFSITEAKSLLELLQSKSRFRVPRFQRNYSWNVEKVETLWSDILDNFYVLNDPSSNEKDAQYLLGPLVLVRASGRRDTYDIIDGQQRLATITMLLCVARDIIMEDLKVKNTLPPSGFDKINELIQNTHMEKRTSWKIELNDTDKEFFREIQEFEDDTKTQLERITESKPKIQSLKLLKDNYVFLHSAITNALYTNFERGGVPDVDNLDDDGRRKLRIKNHSTLIYFLTHLRENNYLIQILVSDDSSAFQIFETLNERGQTLSKSNLIKNHILNKIQDSELQREQSNKWNKIFDDIVGNDQSDDDFIIESYHSRYCDNNSLRIKESKNALPMLKKNLYKIIKKIVTDEDDCKKFIKELERDAEFLSMLYAPSGYDIDDVSKDDIYAIKALKAKYIRIPILAAYRKWYNDNMSDYSKLVELMVKFFFKIRVVQEMHPGKIEDIMNDITKIINEGGSLASIRKLIKEKDKHDDFKSDFVRRFAPKPHNDAAKYVLQKITIHLGTPYDDVKPIDNLTLEHVLPKKHNRENWKRSDFDRSDGDIDDYALRLGNMTLLKKAIHSKVQALPFKLKRDHKDKYGDAGGYNSSSLQINLKTVVNYNSWTASVIKEREQKFVEYADKIWKID